MSKQTQSKFYVNRALLGSALLLAAPLAMAHHPMGGATPSTMGEGLLSGFGHPIIGIDHFAFLLVAALLSFTLSLDDVIISSFVTGPDYQILPLRIYSMVKIGVSPDVNALATLLLVASLFLVVLAQLLLKDKK